MGVGFVGVRRAEVCVADGLRSSYFQLALQRSRGVGCGGRIEKRGGACSRRVEIGGGCSALETNLWNVGGKSA